MAMPSSSSWRNVVLVALVPLPTFIFYWAFLSFHKQSQGGGVPIEEGDEEEGYGRTLWWCLCTWGGRHAIALLNLLFFLNVDVLFWIISLLQKSTWDCSSGACERNWSSYSLIHTKIRNRLKTTQLEKLVYCRANLRLLRKLKTLAGPMQLIDPYWTILPVMMAHYFATHPSSHSDMLRSRVVLTLVWVWSIRLTHSYFRREDWQWGAREDWRYARMRVDNPKHWWWMSFFAVYVSQQIFLVGICLPMYTVHISEKPWNAFDVLATSVCALGVLVAYFADSQLHEFVSGNKTLKKDGGVPKVPVLDRGLWHYSRHPNYFGEQLWWWGLGLFSWNVGHVWAMVGALINSACLAYVTVLVEKKMIEDKYRAIPYRIYQETTSVWIPWFKRRSKMMSNDSKLS